MTAALPNPVEAHAGTWYRQDGNGRWVLSLYIQPNASRTEISGLHDGALKIKIAAPPADHRANDALLEFLGKSFKVSKKQIVLKQGAHARQKIVEVIDPITLPTMLLHP